MTKIKLTDNLSLSQIIRGFWRLDTWELSTDELIDNMKSSIDLGVTSFDTAEIYADTLCESQIGEAFAKDPALRVKVELISKTGFYLYFLLLMGLLLRSYLLIHGILEGVLDQVISFMEALLPAFCMTMVFCSQQVTAVGFYQLSLIVIYLIERVLLYVVIPTIHVYVVLQMLNCMTAGNLISRMTALLKRGLIWAMRLLLAGVTGMNVIERMIAPSVDNLKKMSVTQTISMIPGLGNTAQAVGNIFFGSAAVIRNGIGTAAMIVLLCLAIGPLLKMLIFSVFYKMAGALAEPFSDKRICGCIDCVGDGALLLFRALGTGILLCMITIAVVVTATV